MVKTVDLYKKCINCEVCYSKSIYKDLGDETHIIS